MTTVSAACQMPVLVEVPVNHEAVKELPEPLRSRFEMKKSVEEVAAESERNTRGEEAAARKRRQAADLIRKLEQDLEEKAAKTEKHKREKLEEQEKKRAKREQMTEAVNEARQQANVRVIKKGIENASRACAAVTSREKQVAEVVKRTGEQVKHALAVAQAQKDKTAREGKGEATQDEDAPLDSPHPASSLLDSDRLASPHPAHQQLQSQIQQQLTKNNPSPMQKFLPAHEKPSFGLNISCQSTPRASPRVTSPRRSNLMTISEDKEMITDHRSQAFERHWYREPNASGTGYINVYVIRWDDGTFRTIRGLC